MVCPQQMGETPSFRGLCFRGGGVFCIGFCVDACSGYEAEEVRCPLDGGEYFVSMQVARSPRVLACSILERSVRVVEWADGSFAALQGPVPYIKHLVSSSRIPFTTAYFGSLGLTLYFAVGVSPPFLLIYLPLPPQLQFLPASPHHQCHYHSDLAIQADDSYTQRF